MRGRVQRWAREVLAAVVPVRAGRRAAGGTISAPVFAPDDQVPVVLSDGGLLLTCTETVVGRHALTVDSAGNGRCPRHGWRRCCHIEWGPLVLGLPDTWLSITLDCGATVVPGDAGPAADG